jgi:hypothetical protein
MDHSSQLTGDSKCLCNVRFGNPIATAFNETAALGSKNDVLIFLTEVEFASAVANTFYNGMPIAFPAYIADLFMQMYLGSIHGDLPTAWVFPYCLGK